MRIPLFESLLVLPDWTSLNPESARVLLFFDSLAQGRILPVVAPANIRGWIKLAEFDAFCYLTPAAGGDGTPRPALEAGVRVALAPWLSAFAGLPPREVLDALRRFVIGKRPARKALVPGRVGGLPWRLFLAPGISRESVVAALRQLLGNVPAPEAARCEPVVDFSELAWIQADPDAFWLLEPGFGTVRVVDGWQVVPLTWDLPDVPRLWQKDTSFRWNDRDWLVAAQLKAWGLRGGSMGLERAIAFRVEPAWQWGNDVVAASLVSVLHAWPEGQKVLFLRTSRGFREGVSACVGLRLGDAAAAAVKWVLERALALAESGTPVSELRAWLSALTAQPEAVAALASLAR